MMCKIFDGVFYAWMFVVLPTATAGGLMFYCSAAHGINLSIFIWACVIAAEQDWRKQ